MGPTNKMSGLPPQPATNAPSFWKESQIEPTSGSAPRNFPIQAASPGHSFSSARDDPGRSSNQPGWQQQGFQDRNAPPPRFPGPGTEGQSRFDGGRPGVNVI